MTLIAFSFKWAFECLCPAGQMEILLDISNMFHKLIMAMNLNTRLAYILSLV